MARTTWRFTIIWLLMFWQGGFFFYTSVVVPAAVPVIGGLQQGFITRQVTHTLNITGVLVLGLLLLDMFFERNWGKVFFWVVMVICQGLLFWLHPQLDGLLDHETFSVSDRGAFRPLHRIYLWASSVLWGGSVGYLAIMLWKWRKSP